MAIKCVLIRIIHLRHLITADHTAEINMTTASQSAVGPDRCSFLGLIPIPIIVKNMLANNLKCTEYYIKPTFFATYLSNICEKDMVLGYVKV